MKKYEKPTIQTITSSEIIESLGPVQGYGGKGGASLAGGKGSGGTYATGGPIADISN